MQGNEAEEQLESMRAEMQALQQDLEHTKGQASRAAEIQEQVLINMPSCIAASVGHQILQGYQKADKFHHISQDLSCMSTGARLYPAVPRLACQTKSMQCTADCRQIARLE